MFKLRVILFVVMIVCGRAWAADLFDGVKCSADIPKALVGKHDSSESTDALEKRHKDLSLKNLGGTEISDRVFMASWQICGHEYELLVNRSGLIRDVLAFPGHSTAAPMYIGTCQIDGKEMHAQTVAVLNNSAGYDARDGKLARTMLKATAAWKIDEINGKFVQEATENLGCPLSGIVTADGGP